jgi:nitroreductase
MTMSELIRLRYSCRNYVPEPLVPGQVDALAELLSSIRAGPLGTPLRFQLIAAKEEDGSALRGLGTYGFIKGARAFVIGAVSPGDKNLEDYGYGMERIVLEATGMGLGTCWLGGSFTKSAFARTISVGPAETVPAVISIGRPIEGGEQAPFRRIVGGTRRRPFEQLFFEDGFEKPLTPDRAGPAAAAILEAVRIGPSASNKQPWRIVRQGNRWHFFLKRTPRYGRGTLLFWILRLADLQRVDMGIAMCHFDLQARESGQSGRWVVEPPEITMTDENIEYVVTWVPDTRNDIEIRSPLE